MSFATVLVASLVFVGGNITAKAAPVRFLSPEDERPSTVEELDISGYYKCEGDNPDGGKYRGVVKIEPNNKAYTLSWFLGGTDVSVGVGIRKGDTLAVSYACELPQGVAVAVVVYEIEKGPKLTGQFTELGGDGTVRTETLTFVKKLK